MPARLLVLLLVLFAGLASAQPAGAAELRLGFQDGVFEDPADRAVWLQRAVGSGASVVRLASSWSALARRRPQAPEDPADRAYEWASLDATIKAAVARRLDVILALTGAPTWAEGPGRPGDAAAGSWRPSAEEYGRFARALATRYSGRYPDPASPGAFLPRVRHYQPWNEPNLSRYLAPQWVGRDGRWSPESPRIYRDLLNAFAAGVKGVAASNRVLAGTTAPFGDPSPGGARMQPARFVRELLTRRSTFDVLTHHPYSTRGPFAPALNADDVSIPDLGKLIGPLRRAERAGRVAPRGRRPVWVTEVSFDSSPPDPNGVPERRHAQWLAETFFVLWRQRISLVSWFQIRDEAPEPSFDETTQSGVYLRDGRPKLAQRAFAFPFVARRERGRTIVWARAPAAGTIVFERRVSGRWRRVAAGRARRHGVVLRRVRVRAGTVLRARVRAVTSLTARG